MLYRVFRIQWLEPENGDWSIMAKADLSELGLTLKDIEKMTKYTFKKVVKNQIRSQAFKYLLNLKGTHTKMKMLNYEELKLQPYLENEGISPLQAREISKFRTNM